MLNVDSLFQVWTWLPGSISYDGNHYTMNLYMRVYGRVLSVCVCIVCICDWVSIHTHLLLADLLLNEKKST